MSSDLEIKAQSGAVSHVIVEERSFQAFPFSTQNGFFELESLFSPKKRCDYPMYQSELIPVSTEGFLRETLDGIFDFCRILSRDDSEKNYNSSLSEEYQTLFALFDSSIKQIKPSTPSVPSIVKEKDLSDLAAQVEAIAKQNQSVTGVDLSRAIRRTLRDAQATLYTTYSALPPKVHGQLLAVLIFLKTVPNLPEEISKEADGLFTLMAELEQADASSGANTNKIYYYLGNFTKYVEKVGSWTKSWNGIFGSQYI